MYICTYSCGQMGSTPMGPLPQEGIWADWGKRYALELLGSFRLMGVPELSKNKQLCSDPISADPTPGLNNKIPAKKIFARGWVAQEPICS